MAKGYRGWVYTNPSDGSPLLKVKTGERKVLDVQLEQLPNETAQQ